MVVGVIVDALDVWLITERKLSDSGKPGGGGGGYGRIYEKERMLKGMRQAAPDGDVSILRAEGNKSGRCWIKTAHGIEQASCSLVGPADHDVDDA